MRKEKKHIGLKLILAAIVAFGLFVAFWDVPAPTRTIEKTIPNDTFKN